MGARHITPQEVVEMHRLYKELGTYAAVADKIGRSASSVARYIKMERIPTAIRIAVENLSKREEA